LIYTINVLKLLLQVIVMALPATKRYLIELLHKHKLTYEQVGKYSGIDPQRIKAIKKGEEPTDEEKMKIKNVAYSLSELRQKDVGETMD